MSKFIYKRDPWSSRYAVYEEVGVGKGTYLEKVAEFFRGVDAEEYVNWCNDKDNSF